MKILIDTNVALDYLGANKGFEEDATAIFELALEKKAIELVSASAVTDIYYILKKAVKDRKQTIARFKEFREYVHILPVTESDIDKALERDWKDFEDAVQYTVAETNGVDYIVSRNTKDFEEAQIPCLTPKDFIAKVIQELPDLK